MPKTTAQLEALISKSGDKLKTVIMDVEKLLSSPESAAEVIAHAIAVAEKEIAQHQDVLVMTSRKLVTGDDAKKSLDIGSVVADALVKFLQQLKVKPRYVIAKVSTCETACLVGAELTESRYRAASLRRTWQPRA